MPPVLAAVMVRNRPTLVDPFLGGVGRFGRKVLPKADRGSVVRARGLNLAAVGRFEPLNRDKEGGGETPHVAVHVGQLPPLAGRLAGLAVPILQVRHAALGLDPFLKGGALTGNLEDIEGLPLVVLGVALLALDGLAHHAKEEVDDRAHVAMRKGGPAVVALLGHGLFGLVGRLRKGRNTPLFVERLVEIVEEPDHVFVTVILSRLAKGLVDGALDEVPHNGEESHGAHIRGPVGRPHAANQILIGEEEFGLGRVLVGAGRLKVFSQAEDIPLGNGPKKLEA